MRLHTSLLAQLFGQEHAADDVHIAYTPLTLPYYPLTF